MGRTVVRLDGDAYARLPAMLAYGHDDPALLPQSLIGFDLAGKQNQTHLYPHRFRADRRQTGERQNAFFALLQQLMASQAHGRPVVLLKEVDGCGHAQIGRGIDRPDPGEIVQKGRQARVVALPTVADDQRLQQMLAVGAGVEKAGPTRAAEPFVAVATVEVGADRLQIQIKLAGRMRAVHNCEDAGLSGPPTDLGNGQNQRGRRGDVAERNDLRAFVDTGPDLAYYVSGVGNRHGDRLADQSRAQLLAVEAPGTVDCAILVRGAQNLIALLQVE